MKCVISLPMAFGNGFSFFLRKTSYNYRILEGVQGVKKNFYCNAEIMAKGNLYGDSQKYIPEPWVNLR